MSDKTRIENNAFKHSDINEDDSDIAMAKFESFIEGAKSRDQELASLREQLEKEQEISQRLSDDLASALDTIEQKEDENRELVNEIDQLILHAEEDSLTYSVLEHARKLVFKTNHPDGYKKAN